MSFKDYVKDTATQVLGFVLMFLGVLIAIAPLSLSLALGIPEVLCYICVVIGFVVVVLGILVARYAVKKIKDKRY